MKIVRRINTNAALAIDSAGKEIVVFGKGIGFPQTPYELTDLTKIQRTFYDISPKYHAMIAELPQDVVLASAEIAELAETGLNCELNPNLPFTLADHLNFAMSRVQSGMVAPLPLSYDVRHLYPEETKLGFQALDVLEKYAGIHLPEGEAYSVALHIINAEAESGTIASLMRTLDVIREMEKIVENHYGAPMDQQSYAYSRFMMHLQYLVQRLQSGMQVEERNSRNTVFEIARQYPDAYVCANRVCDHLDKEYGWRCNSEEVLYLMMHIQRVQTASPT